MLPHAEMWDVHIGRICKAPEADMAEGQTSTAATEGGGGESNKIKPAGVNIFSLSPFSILPQKN